MTAIHSMRRENVKRRAESKPETAHVKIFEVLRRKILSSNLMPGVQLTEADIAKQFSVSTTPVREALQMLIQHGLADRRAKRGVAVHQVTPQEVDDVYAMRAIIEPAALLESAPSLTAGDYESINGLLAEAKEAIARFENEKLSEINSAIHTSLYKKARNDILLSWLEQLRDKHKLISLYGWRAGTPRMQEWQEHDSIVTDCKNGQFDAAAARLRDHILTFKRNVAAADSPSRHSAD